MKNLLTLIFILFFSLSYGQSEKIYDPQANADQIIQKALQIAKQQDKHLFMKIGGNWCPWCIKFHNFCEEDSLIRETLDKHFIVVNLNYSKENKNLPLLETLEYPQRFGFPVFVILDKDGKRIHTQNSAYLEEDKGYSQKKVIEFLNQWSPEALNPKSYQNK